MQTNNIRLYKQHSIYVTLRHFLLKKFHIVVFKCNSYIKKLKWGFNTYLE